MERFENVSLLAVVSMHGHFWYSIPTGGTNGDVFIEFFKNLSKRLLEIYKDYKPKCFI
jgi:hypothetical protein